MSVHGPRFVGRHPLFDRGRRVIGYELLYRRGYTASADVLDDDEATLDVIYGTLMEVGLDAVVGDVRAWVNVSGTFLTQGLHRLLDPERVVLELLETAESTPELHSALTDVTGEGYLVALDDFLVGDGRDELMELASVVKLELPAIGVAGLAAQVEAAHAHGMTVLVEKVETPAEYEAALAAGADLFQGYFFARPEILTARSHDPSRLAVLLLLTRITTSLELEELTEAVGTDAALAQKVLQAVNSGYVALRHRVRSLHQAVVLLGPVRLQQLATLILLARATGKPSELSRQTLLRAELAAGLVAAGCFGPSRREDVQAAFTVGLLSTVDAFTDSPMADAVARLGVDDTLRDALVDRSGRLGDVLSATLAFEDGGPPDAVDADLAQTVLLGALERTWRRWGALSS